MLQLNQDEFIDLCILMGCDFCPKIRGIGFKTAYKLIKQYRSIDTILNNLEDRYVVPDVYPYEEARKFFKDPLVYPTSTLDLSSHEPDEEGLITFLCGEKGFNEERIRNGISRLKSYKNAQVKTRITDYFKPSPKKLPTSINSPISLSSAKEKK